MSEFDNAYLDWLASYVRMPTDTYSRLLLILYSTRFRFVTRLDANWLPYGIGIRQKYMASVPIESWSDDIYNYPCSVLEVLIAIAEAMEDALTDVAYGDRTSVWFMDLLKNLGLDIYTDSYMYEGSMMDLEYAPMDGEVNKSFNYICADDANINKIIDDWMRRKFGYDGRGSVFPLRHPECDQRTIPIVRQMGYYLTENYFEE